MSYLLFFSLGASIASFLCLVVDRFPQSSIITPASHCNHCQKRLAVRDLIPIISQLLSRSRCRYCQSLIPKRYMLIELVCGMLFLLFSQGVINLSELIISFMSLTLSLYDLDKQEYPVIIWGIFTLPLLFIGHINLWTILLFLLGCLALILPVRIGSGDFFYLASLSLCFSIDTLLWTIQLAAWLGIIYLVMQRQLKKPIAFVPFLAISLSFVVIIQHLI